MTEIATSTTLDSEGIRTPNSETRSKIFKIVVRVLVTAAILFLVFWQVSWNSVWQALLALHTSYTVWVVLLCIPTQWFQYLRWSFLARRAGPEVTSQEIHRGFWVGFTLSLITPGRIGAYGRALALKNCSLSRAAGLTIIERSYSSIVLYGLGLAALAMLPALGWKSPLPAISAWVLSLLLASATALLLLAIYPPLIVGPLRRLIPKLPFRDKLLKALSALEELQTSHGIYLTFLSVAALVSSLLQFVLLIRGMGIEVPILSGMLAVMLNFFLKSFMPISIGSLGVSEWTAMLCLAGLGVDASVAVASSLLLFSINVLIPGLIGLPFIHSLRTPPPLQWRKSTS